MSSKYGLLAFLIIILSSLSYADTRNQVWPEVDVFYKLNNRFRIRLAEGITRSQAFTDAVDGFVEADLDFGVKRSIKRRFMLRDADRNKLLTLRVGYSTLPQSPEGGK